MEIFATAADSHQHSLNTLQAIEAYDDFMLGIKSVCDMGTGYGHDIRWWAESTYIDDTGVERPRNYDCYAVDLSLSNMFYPRPANITALIGNFEEPILPKRVDLMWSHDSFRYAVNPLNTLKVWNEQININGALVLIVPQTTNIIYNRPVTRTFPGCYFSYNITNLLYMLAVNGFDCSDGQFMKQHNDPWIHCLVYKHRLRPMDPATTTWYHLAERNLLPASAVECINKYGYLKQEELQTHWLDGQYCQWSQV